MSGHTRRGTFLILVLIAVLLPAMAGPATAAISPSRDANTVANAITDSLSAGVFTGASFPVIPPAPGDDIPECSDGDDNDGDGNIDFTPPAGAAADPGCEASSGGADDNREQDDAPPQCSNGFDDDDDGLIDFAPPSGESQDPGCGSMGDNDEGSEGQSITPECADGLDNDEDGTTDFGSGGDPGCSSAEDNRELDDRLPECSNGFDDDGDDQTDSGDPGCEDGQDDLEEDGATNPTPECSNGFDDDGDERTDFSGGDTGCSSDADLDEGSEGEPLPASPECSDGADNDGDGQTDFSADPGCQDADDNRELDDEAPQCSNGQDDDGDDKLDFAPSEGDPGCSSASDLDEGSEGLPPGLDPNPAAVGDSSLGGFPSSAPTFAILSSGNTTFADDPNESSGTGQSNGNGPGTEAHGPSFNDLVKLKVDLDVPAGMNCLRLDFRFLSEEFPEYVGGSVNDGFVAELDTSNFTADPQANNAVVAPNNFAFDSEGQVISINTAGFSEEEAAGTTYDGATSELRASTPITPGAHAVYLSVFDQGDSILDSAAFIDSMTVENAPGATCQKGTTTDTTPPAVTLTAPADDTSTDDTTPTYSGGAGDAFGDSNTVTVKVYSGSSVSGTPVQTLTATRSGNSWSVDGSTALSPGTYTAQAEQTDASGNTGQSSANTFTIGAPDTVSPAVNISAAPPPSTTDRDASFSFGSSEPGVSFECRLDGGAFAPCSSPVSYGGLSEGPHTFELRARDSAGNTTTASYSWTIAADAQRKASLADLPPPVVGELANVEVVKGTVLVAIPAGKASVRGAARASQKGLKFVPLQEARQIPIGSFLNTRKGTVRLQSATGAATTKPQTQQGSFAGGLFQVLQSRKKRAKGLTDLLLKGGNFNSCKPKRGKGAQAAISRKRLRRLAGNARGRYRTRGKYAAATVRGTKWTVTDRCDGTLTKVARGKVAVRDFRRKRTILVRAGKSYLAKAKR